MLKAINIGHDGVRACLDDLIEDVKHLANSKQRLPNEDSRVARSLLSREWTEIETNFLMELTKTLDRSAVHAISLSKEVSKSKKALLETARPRKTSVTSLQREINELEDKIRRQRAILETTEAAQAPSAAVLCQASSHIGLCGFRMEEYTGLTLQLSFEHAVGGVESKFQFDLQTNSISASLAEVDTKSDSLVPVGHEATKFQRHFLMSIVDNASHLSEELEVLDLREQILTLSSWLGRLDTTTIDLFKAAENSLLKINMPSVSVSFSNGMVLDVTYEDRGVNESFVPSKVEVTGKSRKHLKLPCRLKTSNYLKKVVELCAAEVVC
jgi:hypothetical protein